MENLESVTKCLHQIFKPKGKKLKWLIKEGYGDCYSCTYNPEENSNCKGYYPIKVYTICVVKLESYGVKYKEMFPIIKKKR